MNQKKKKVVIVGGGITGLTSAFYLNRAINQYQLPIELTLIEANHRLGGKIQTEYKDGFVIEKGPDSFLERKSNAKQLVQDVGLEHDLVRNTAGKTHIVVKDQMHAMPLGAVMGIPTKFGPFLKTGLFSVQGKVRAACDYILPRSRVEGDQSIGSFIRRRLGDEVAENLVEPLLSGIYIGDIDQLSLLSTFPQFYEAEQEHGSLIRGLKKMSKTASETTLTSKNQGVFLTLKNGLQSLVDAIETQLKDVTIQKGVSVKDLKKGKDGHYELNLNDDESLQADGVILALPHPMMAELMLDKNYLKDYKDMPATTVATVVTAFNEDAINLADGVGFVVSRHSDYTITACTWTHKKWPHTAPKGMALLRCYVGRIGEETVVDLSDTEIEEMVLEDLKKTLNITAKPKFSIVTRWMNAFPQYNVGHYQRMNEMHEALCKDMPGVYVTGSSCGGLGLPDCITQGKVAAEKIRAYFE
ncbi:protoporphyrinogen oxidase [Lederbergia galactosidilytica]|uniref:Coproporphyrinogen III oxidase n=1 Tax=Lederbergia galactosidilytica TaxID=217031 RepID=A0A177ZJI9_9BACI|nr:protoporphyrinogen oxidase [Lederbergia galactosidilytica]OAK67763.1 protoporphyrinogen oxidase [Lederbergia galactosidilytica]